MRLVLDAGTLVAVDRDDRAITAQLRVANRTGTPLLTSAAVVAQVWRNGARQSGLARILAGVTTIGMPPEDGRKIGALLARSKTSDVVDAHLATLVSPGDKVLTSDPDDIAHLLRVRGVRAQVQRV